MSLFISAIASGSNGNCYYVGNHTEAVLVDAGISCREIDRRMKRLGLGMEKVKAVFVSHEHSDHIRGLPSLTKKHNLPVYITTPTLRNGRLFLDKRLIMPFKPNEPVAIGELRVTGFSKSHDAADPYSFIISCREIKVGVFTDIGTPCKNLIHHFSQCHAAFLEANYDDVMLEEGNYPRYLKNRIRGGQGHLSNRQALDVFKRYRPTFMSHLLLAHLSENNNCPKLVKELFTAHAEDVHVVVASRYEETGVFHIHNAGNPKPKTRPAASTQMQLDFL